MRYLRLAPGLRCPARRPAGLSLLPVAQRARCVYTRAMDLTAVIEDIDAEISRLEKVRALLTVQPRLSAVCRPGSAAR
jgi:hypothetical protein